MKFFQRLAINKTFATKSNGRLRINFIKPADYILNPPRINWQHNSSLETSYVYAPYVPLMITNQTIDIKPSLIIKI